MTFPGEPALLWLIGVAFLARFSGAALRAGNPAFGRVVGWVLAACAAWLVAAAAGAFSPIGLAIAIGFGFALIDRFERRLLLRALGDATAVTAACLLSIPVLDPTTIALWASGAAVAGSLLDLLASTLFAAAPVGSGAPDPVAEPGESGVASSTPRRRPALRAVVVLSPVLLWVAHGWLYPETRAEFLREKYPQIAPAAGPFFAAARADVGERIELDTGAIGWLTLPPGPPPYRPALFFHGSDDDGAYQRGGLFVRRTLVGLGYAVLAVDERGFGASPRAESLTDVGAWDPLPTSQAAARYLESRADVAGSVLAVGHSMGATRVLRFLSGWPGASAGIIMGATVMPAASENERFYHAFLDDYDLEDSNLDPAFVLEVRGRYFNNDAASTALPRGHAPVLFFRFAFDYENIIEGREALYGLIPGNKLRWELRADHQFGSSRVRGVLTGDWRTMRSMQRAIGRFVDGVNPNSGRPMRTPPRR